MNDLSYEARAKGALGREDFRFSHRLGQNFIMDDNVVDEIAACSGAQAGDAVLEIGPGAGTLTAALVRRGARVMAVEVDKNLEPVLKSLLGENENVRLRFGDILKCDLNELHEELSGMRAEGGALRVAANLPYYITSDVLTRFAKSDAEFDSLTIMVQREAAERIMARVGQKQYCLLSALLEWHYDIEAAMELPRTLFTPPPHVDSTLLRLTPKAAPAQIDDIDTLHKTMSAAFLMRRKTMLNNLSAAFSLSRDEAAQVLEDAGLNKNVRGEALTQNELAALSNAVHAHLNRS